MGENLLGTYLPDGDDWPAFRECAIDAAQACASGEGVAGCCATDLAEVPDETWRARLDQLTGRGHAAVAAVTPDGTWVAFLSAYLDGDGRRTCAIVRDLFDARLSAHPAQRASALAEMWDHIERWARACGACEVVLELSPDDPDHPDVLRGRGYRPTGRHRPGVRDGCVEMEWSKALRAPRRPTPAGAAGRLPALF